MCTQDPARQRLFLWFAVRSERPRLAGKVYGREAAGSGSSWIIPRDMSAALSKRLLWDTLIKGCTPRQVADLETQSHHRVMGSADAREGVEAFLERRTPQWSSSVSRKWKPLPEL